MGKSGGVDKERWRGAGGVTERGEVERTSGERIRTEKAQEAHSPGPGAVTLMRSWGQGDQWGSSSQTSNPGGLSPPKPMYAPTEDDKVVL